MTTNRIVSIVIGHIMVTANICTDYNLFWLETMYTLLWYMASHAAGTLHADLEVILRFPHTRRAHENGHWYQREWFVKVVILVKSSLTF